MKRRRRAARDYSQRLARGLPRLGSHLAIVVTLHLLTEFLLDRLIKAKRNLDLIDDDLFRNLDALRKLRNEYAHGLDADLATKLNLGFVDERGGPVFRRPAAAAQAVTDDPEGAGLEALMAIRDATFGRLHQVCLDLGVDLEPS